MKRKKHDARSLAPLPFLNQNQANGCASIKNNEFLKWGSNWHTVKRKE